MDPNAIVGLRVSTSDSKGHGTGFFVSETGRIVTCYHVIEGAESVQVLRRNRTPNKRVRVEGIWPERDLATLVIEDLEEATPMLRLDTNFQPDGFDINVESLGYFYDLSDAYAKGTLTHSGWLKSSRIRDKKGFPIFDQEIDLIGMDILAYTGRSGSPIFFNKHVIGILCGSLEEGREFSWAIPVKYLEKLRSVDRPPAQITNWDPVSLMAERYRRSLRTTFRLAAGLGSALDDYYDAVEAVIISDAKANAELSAIVEILPILSGSLNEAKLALKNGASWTDAMSGLRFMLEELLGVQGLEGRAFDVQKAARVNLASATHRLGFRLENVFAGTAPVTLRNIQIRDDAISALANAIGQFEAIDYSEETKSASKLLNSIGIAFSRVSSATDDASIPVINQAIDDAVSNFEIAVEAGQEMLASDSSNRRHEIMNELTQGLERTVFVNYDRAVPFRHESINGFEISLPVGWTLATPELLQRIGMQESIPYSASKDMDFYIRTGLFGDLDNAVGLDNINVIVSPFPFSSDQLANTTDNIRLMVQSGLLGPNARDYSDSWTTINGRTAFVVNATFGDEVSPDFFRQVYMDGPSHLQMTITCRSWHGRSISFCGEMIESMKLAAAGGL